MNTSFNILWIRRLLWAYFWLLIFEGALRKWAAPSLAGPLLLIRVPVVLAAYVLALRAGVFPRGLAVTAIGAVAFLSLFASLAVLPDAPGVVLYGFQADFLQLPLIFLVPRVFDGRDVRRMGYWTLMLALPLAVLMTAQFRAPGSSWLNAGAGEGAAQITLAEGHIRAAATFSFITGAATFFTLTAAFLFEYLFAGRRAYPAGLVVSAAFATVLAAGVAGSRTLVVSLGVVLACALFMGTFLQPRLLMRSLRVVFLLAFVGLVAVQLPVFSEGLRVFGVRVEGANKAEGGTEGIFQSRILNGYTEPFARMMDARPLGQGLGLGTVGGMSLTKNNSQLALEGSWETEWDRNIVESGPVLGLCFIVLRFSLMIGIGLSALRHARHGNTLPLLLFVVCSQSLTMGNFGQSTTVGFVVLVMGLCLAAMRPQAQTASHKQEMAGSNPLQEVCA